MKLSLYHVDAFTNKLFTGNPAAVCPLDTWLPDEIMQAIASENNLSETGFFIPQNNDYAIRWFTPTYEIDLCGHGTLSAAYVIFEYLRPDLTSIIFHSKSGPLIVSRNEMQLITLDFPARQMDVCASPQALLDGLKLTPKEIYRSSNNAYVAILEHEEQVKNCEPDFAQLATLELDRVIISAPGTTVDFVSRYFIPKEIRREDPVTGAAHCVLAPYWSRRLKKETLHARQLSKRGGEMICTLKKDRVLLTGKVVPYFLGTIFLPE